MLAQDKTYPLDGTFLYVEAGPGWSSASIFKDLGDRLVYRWEMENLSSVIMELWDAAPEDQKWSAMEYRIENGKFEASFTYDPRDPEASMLDRRERILRQRYGNKHIEYPPLV